MYKKNLLFRTHPRGLVYAAVFSVVLIGHVKTHVGTQAIPPPPTPRRGTRLGGGGGLGREKHLWLENTSSPGKKFNGPLHLVPPTLLPWMAASLGILVIRSSLVDWWSMKKECRHARHNRNTLYGRLLLYPSLTELPSIEIK